LFIPPIAFYDSIKIFQMQTSAKAFLFDKTFFCKRKSFLYILKQKGGVFDVETNNMHLGDIFNRNRDNADQCFCQ